MVLDGGSGRRSPATVNKHLAALFSFYDYQARNGVALAQALVSWRRSNRAAYKSFLHHASAGRPAPTRPLRLRQARRLPQTLSGEEITAIVEACEHLRAGSCWSCSRKPACASARPWGCATAISSPTAGSCASCPGRTTPTGRGPRPWRRPPSRSRPGWCASTAPTCSTSTAKWTPTTCSSTCSPRRWGRFRYQAVHKLVGRLRARTGIDFNLHMLRHSAATDLLRRGVAVDVVAKLLTQRSSTTTSRAYVHLDVADLRAELVRAGAWIEAGS